MEDFSFTGLGTQWSISIDGALLRDQDKEIILQYVQAFENRFSRFLPHSEVNAFRVSLAGEYVVSGEFTRLLARADMLRRLTGGVYDPGVASVLENAGYGARQGLSPLEKKDGASLSKWSLVGETLTIGGPIGFDFGGIGKGYCIDRIAEIMKELGYHFFLVDGGGDMVATTKADGSAWRVAIEYPGKPELAASIVALVDRGLAVSDTFRRRFGTWHHLIDAQEKKPIERMIGCAAVARDAWAADCMTSGLFFAPEANYGALAREFAANFLVFRSDGTAGASTDWPGELL